MAMPFIKYLSVNDNNDNNDINLKALKIIELMILYCKNPNNTQNKSLIIAQTIFIKALIECYKNCQTKFKFEFPKTILSIFYHLFGDRHSFKNAIDETIDQKQNDDNNCDDIVLHQCLMEIRNICIASLGSRMYLKHRLDIFKLIQMSLIFEGYEWLIIDKDKNKFFKK